MSTEIAGSHTNGTMGDADSSKRDIKNHMLFEVSTEAANRGDGFPACIITLANPSQSAAYTP